MRHPMPMLLAVLAAVTARVAAARNVAVLLDRRALEAEAARSALLRREGRDGPPAPGTQPPAPSASLGLWGFAAWGLAAAAWLLAPQLRQAARRLLLPQAPAAAGAGKPGLPAAAGGGEDGGRHSAGPAAGELLEAPASSSSFRPAPPQQPVRSAACERPSEARPGEAAPLLLHAPVEAAAAARPEAVAVLSASGAPLATFGELEAGANRLARWLRREGLVQGSPVAVALLKAGISAPRTHELHFAALLAVLKSGSPYVPVDLAAWPAGRQGFVLADCGATFVLTDAPRRSKDGNAPEDRHLHDCLLTDGLADPCVGLGRPWPRVLRLAEMPAGLAAGELPPQEGFGGVSEGDACHLLYTSGSSGRPKGVRTPHRAAAHRCRWMRNAFPADAAEVGIAKTPLCFVDHVWETFGLLGIGAALCDFPHARRGDVAFMLKALHSCRVTRLVLTPTLARRLLDTVRQEPWQGRLPASLRQVTLSGEALPATLLQEVLEALPSGRGASVLNLYGSTEVAGDVTWEMWLRDEHVGPGRKSLAVPSGQNPSLRSPQPPAIAPLGRPVPGCDVQVLDPDTFLPVAPGKRGELVVLGAHLADGYVHPDEPGAAGRFVTLPGKGERAFRTGDFGCRDEGGTIWYSGREDDMIKIRGERVELQEVQVALDALLRGRGGAAHSSTEPAAVPEGLARAARLALAEVAPGAVISEAAVTAYTEPGPPAERRLAALLPVPRGALRLGPAQEAYRVKAEAAVRTALHGMLPPNAIPARVVFLEGPTESPGSKAGLLPRLPSGKLDRQALRLTAEAASRQVKPPKPLLDSLGLLREWEPEAAEVQRLVQGAYAVLMLMVVQGHFWGEAGVAGDPFPATTWRTNSLSKDVAMTGFVVLAAAQEVAGPEATAWPGKRDALMLGLRLAMHWPLPQLVVGTQLLLAGGPFPEPLERFTNVGWFLVCILWSRAFLALGRAAHLPGWVQVPLLLVVMRALSGLPPSDSSGDEICRAFPGRLVDADGCLLDSGHFRRFAAEDVFGDNFLQSVFLRLAHFWISFADPRNLASVPFVPIYVLAHHVMQQDFARGGLKSMARWLRGGEYWGTKGTRVPLHGRVLGLAGLLFFLVHYFYALLPREWDFLGRDACALGKVATDAGCLRAVPHVSLDFLALAGLLVGLLTFPEIQLEGIGRTVLGTYVVHGYFLRRFLPCAELAPFGLKQDDCAPTAPMFAGLRLFDLELVPAPPVALARFHASFGNSGLWVDLSAELLLWAYPLLFMCTFGALLHHLLMWATMEAPGLVAWALQAVRGSMARASDARMPASAPLAKLGRAQG